MTVSPCQNR